MDRDDALTTKRKEAKAWVEVLQLQHASPMLSQTRERPQLTPCGDGGTPSERQRIAFENAILCPPPNLSEQVRLYLKSVFVEKCLYATRRFYARAEHDAPPF